jgi:serine/threonine protein phosphatase PrpC
MAISSTAASSFDLSLLRCAAGTDVGMRREENQDSFGVIRNQAFHAYFIADGMGGAQGGATASRMAISTLQEALSSSDVRVSPTLITRTVKRINLKIFEKGSAEPAFAGMGTTLVGLVFTPDGLLAVNVGDSRAYRVRDSSITQISEDHTLVRELVQSGALAAEEAHEHPISHMLTRSLGPLSDVDVECRAHAELPLAGDIYVLCSDGLYNYVPPEDILAVVRQNPIDDANQILINLANQRGGSDNITVLVIAVGEKAPRGRKNSLPPLDLESDADPDPFRGQIVPADASTRETSVVPPSVKEPVDPKTKRKLLRELRTTTISGNRTLPMTLALGATLVVGLILGNFARRASLLGKDAWDWVSSSLGPADSAQTSGVISPDPESNPLATLAKQIQAERGENGSVLSGVPNELRRPPAVIEQTIARLQAQIEELSQPVKATAAQNLAAAQERLVEIQENYDSVESSLDVASRAVTLWLGRQVAFEGQQSTLDSRADIEQFGAYSDSVKEKLAALTIATYQYRTKADEIELHPEDRSLRGELEAVETRREQLRRELSQEIRKVVNTTLSKSFKDYENLKIQRDLLWLDLQSAKQEVEVLTGLTNPDTLKRQQLRLALIDRLESEQVALEAARQASRGPVPSR